MSSLNQKQLEYIQQQIEELKHNTKDKPTFFENKDKEIISILSTLVEGFTEVYMDGNVEERRMIGQLTRLATQVEQLSVDMKTLCKVVKDGNGQPSLLQRITVVETQVQSHNDDIKRIEDYSNVITQAKYTTRKDLMVGLFSAVAGIITLFISYLAI